MNKTIFFATLAMNQTEFFENLGNRLSEHGYSTCYICFDEESYAYLVKKNCRAFNVYRDVEKLPALDDIDEYNICNLDDILIHEKAYYKLINYTTQKQRLAGYLTVISGYLDGYDPENTYLIQEFGGFISVASVFYAAQKKGINNYFIEPSFYKGRVFFQKNTYAARKIMLDEDTTLTPEVRAILDGLLDSKSVVIPSKDKRHYRSSLSKIIDAYNVKRLLQKLVFKHVLRKKQEFQYIWIHVTRHIEMALNRLRIRKRYAEDLEPAPYIYYPLHVPNDASLTIRSPAYFDQIRTLKMLSENIPGDYRLFIKEHPALVGAYNYRDMKNLLDTRDNIRILRPDMNNYDVVQKCSAMITVNSKAGAEALLLGKNVIVLGDAFYGESEDVIKFSGEESMRSVIDNALSGENAPDQERVRRFFQAVWSESLPGELYYNGAENLGIFTDSVLKAIES